MASVQSTDPWAKAGVMIRETLGAGATFVDMMVTPGSGLAFQYRQTTGGNCNWNGAGGTAPAWVKLVRSGSTFTAYSSTDGSNWSSLGSTTVTMAAGVYIGLAVTAHNNSLLNTSTLDNVAVTAGNTPPPPPSPPVISSATTASGTVNQAFSYQIAASNSPTSYNATNLPAGLSVNTSSGAITGTPTTAGASSVTISATNAGGTGTATLSITIKPAAPVISSATTASGTVNQAFSYQITASNSPTSYNATNLPAGLSVNTSSGAITGTPTAAGTSSVTISATNAGGTGTATLSITIKPAAPVITQRHYGQRYCQPGVQLPDHGQQQPHQLQRHWPAGRPVREHEHRRDHRHAHNGGRNKRHHQRHERRRHGHGHADHHDQRSAPAAPVITSATTASGTVGTGVQLPDHGQQQPHQLTTPRPAGRAVRQHEHRRDHRHAHNGGRQPASPSAPRTPAARERPHSP